MANTIGAPNRQKQVRCFQESKSFSGRQTVSWGVHNLDGRACPRGRGPTRAIQGYEISARKGRKCFKRQSG